jgi:hypothetical protein
MTLREHEYHIGTSNYISINMVVIYATCINPKKTLQKEWVEEGIT